MKAKLALIVLMMFVIARGSLSASEAVCEVIITTELQASAFVIPGELPPPSPIEALSGEAVPARNPSLPLPTGLPRFKPKTGFGKGLFDANLVLMVGLNIADYISTREALKYPGLVETNPLMKPFVKNPAVFAALKIGTTAVSYWSMKAIFKKNRTVAWIMTTASNALLSYIVANNLRLIQSARTR